MSRVEIALRLGVTALCGIALAFSVYATELDDDEKLSLARETVEAYFEALSAGDVEQLGELLVGRYGDSRKRIIGHEGYDQRLRKVYGSARFDIDELELSGQSEAVALTAIDLSAEERSRVRLYLRLADSDDGPVYRIYDETVEGTVY